jgi:hypothetical protein
MQIKISKIDINTQADFDLIFRIILSFISVHLGTLQLRL